jgi:hypothetical protein
LISRDPRKRRHSKIARFDGGKKMAKAKRIGKTKKLKKAKSLEATKPLSAFPTDPARQ